MSLAVLLSIAFAALLLARCADARAAGQSPDAEPVPAHPPCSVPVAIPSHGARMAGAVYVAAGAGPHPTVLMAHGWPGYETNLDVAQELRRSGFNVLTFRFRGAWGSEGAYSIHHLADDVRAVLAFLTTPENAADLRVDVERLALFGHSLGGFAVLATARHDDRARCVCAVAPANPWQIREGVKNGDTRCLQFVELAGGMFMLRDFDGEALRRQLDVASKRDFDPGCFGASLAGKSLLVLAADHDETTPPAVARGIVEAYADVPGLEVEHHLLSGDHVFSWSRLDLTRRVRDWLVRELH